MLIGLASCSHPFTYCCWRFVACRAVPASPLQTIQWGLPLRGRRALYQLCAWTTSCSWNSTNSCGYSIFMRINSDRLKKKGNTLITHQIIWIQVENLCSCALCNLLRTKWQPVNGISPFDIQELPIHSDHMKPSLVLHQEEHGHTTPA